MTTTTTAVIEADLSELPPAPDLDPLSRALRERGYRSVSVGLRTVQLDGALYDLCPVGQAVVDSWLRGYRAHPRGTVRLMRRTIAGLPAHAASPARRGRSRGGS